MSESDPFTPPRQQSSQVTCALVVLIGLAVLAALFILLAMVAFLVLPMMMVPGDGGGSAVGGRLPTVDLVPLTGDAGPVDADDLKGRVVLVNVWATWCPPCQDEFPHIVELHKEFSSNDDFVMICLSIDGDDVDKLRTNTEKFLELKGADIPTYTDPTGATIQGIMQVTGDQGIPQTLVIDRTGTIRCVWIGYRPGSEQEMKRRIEELLSE